MCPGYKTIKKTGKGQNGSSLGQRRPGWGQEEHAGFLGACRVCLCVAVDPVSICFKMIMALLCTLSVGFGVCPSFSERRTILQVRMVSLPGGFRFDVNTVTIPGPP